MGHIFFMLPFIVLCVLLLEDNCSSDKANVCILIHTFNISHAIYSFSGCWSSGRKIVQFEKKTVKGEIYRLVSMIKIKHMGLLKHPHSVEVHVEVPYILRG